MDPRQAPAVQRRRFKWIALIALLVALAGGAGGAVFALRKPAASTSSTEAEPAAVQPMTFSSLSEPAQPAQPAHPVQSVPAVLAVQAMQDKTADATPSPSAEALPDLAAVAGAVDMPNLAVSTFSPTPGPTSSPSSSPTASPTEQPTQAPTSSPTPKPTTKPTSSPTSSPTPKPTSSPTLSPSSSPSASPTEQPTQAPTSSPTKKPTSKPTASPTAAPTIASYRIDYSPGYLANAGYYYFDTNSARYGTYHFYYDEAGAKAGGVFAYRFTYTPKDGSPLLEVQYSPYGGAHSASGLYHHRDYTLHEQGTYHASQGSKRETGTYAYYRFQGQNGGAQGNLQDAAFVYIYSPHTQTHGSLTYAMPTAPVTAAPTKRPTPSPTKAPTVRPTAAPTTLRYEPSAEQWALPGHYRIDYSWLLGYPDKGYYYVDKSSSHYGWYEFSVLTGAPRSIYGHPEAYRFDYKPSRYSLKQTAVTVYYAPYNDPEPVVGLYHEGHTKPQQAGYYELIEGNDKELGIYFYYSDTKLTGGSGKLSGAVFYYLYFPYQRTRTMKPGFR